MSGWLVPACATYCVCLWRARISNGDYDQIIKILSTKKSIQDWLSEFRHSYLSFNLQVTKEHWTLSGMLYPMCSRAVLVHGWGCAYIDPVGTGYDGVAKMFRYITLVTSLTYNTRVN